MKTHRTSFRSFALSLVVASLGLSAALPAFSADGKSSVNGAWSWTSPGRNGGPERKSTIHLKAEGEKLTGKLAGAGRDGAPVETPISDGKVTGDAVEFNVVRENNGQKFVAHYVGKVEGDVLKGKIETERDGQKQSRDWEAKRDAEKK